MERIDVFAHVLPERFYAKMLAVEPTIPQTYAFFNNPVLQSVEERRRHWDGTIPSFRPVVVGTTEPCGFLVT